MTRVKLDLRANGTGLVELDGVDVSTAVAGLTVNANVGDMTSVLIRLPEVAVTMDGVARVKLAPQVRELLVAAGWTPPGPPRTDDLGTPLHTEDVDGVPDDGDPNRDTGAGLRLMRERGMLA